MKLSKPVLVEVDSHASDYVRALEKTVVTDGPQQTQLVFCILPSSKKDIYDAVKVACCTKLNVPSQCVILKTLSKKQTQLSVCAKIAQQVNCKLGGQLWAMKVRFLFFIFIFMTDN
jgi:aubergine